MGKNFIFIPEQLKKERLILLNQRDKTPAEKWTERQYSAEDVNFLAKLQDGHNYGVVCGGINSLVVIDIDAPSPPQGSAILGGVVAELGETFAVKTRRGFHLYYYVPGYTGGTTVTIDGVHVDIRSDGQYVVGPGSIHPSGTVYEVAKDKEIATIEFSKFTDWLVRHGKVPEEKKGQQPADDTWYVFDIEQVPPWALKRLEEVLAKDEELASMVKFNQVPKRFDSRSERDYAAIVKLIGYGLSRFIPAIFMAYPIGEKMKEHPKPRHYILKTIESAKAAFGIRDYPQVEDILTKIYMAKSGRVVAAMVDSLLEKLAEIEDENIVEFVISEINKKTRISKKSLFARFRKLADNMHDTGVISISEIMKIDVKEIDYWLKPFIPKASLVLIGGKPGSFKSNIAMLFSLLMVSRTQLDSRTMRLQGKPKILYYDLENDAQVVAMRVKYFANGVNIEPDGMLSFRNMFSKFDMNKEIEICKGYDIIVLDSYRRFLEGDENKSEVTDKFYRTFLKKMRDMGKTVVILHHVRKSRADGTFSDDDLIDAFRGSSDIPSQMDLVYSVIKGPVKVEGNRMSFPVFMKPAKNRYGIPIPTIRLDVVKDDDNMETTVEVVKTSISTNADLVRDSIIKYLSSCTNNEEVRSILVAKVAKNTGKTDRWVREQLTELEKQGVISRENDMVKLNQDMLWLIQEKPEKLRCL